MVLSENQRDAQKEKNQLYIRPYLILNEEYVIKKEFFY